MTKQQMMENMNRQLQVAINEAKEGSCIDGIYSYMISEEVKVASPNSDDVLVSISIYTPNGDNEVKLVLSGIDNDGVIDLIDVAEANEVGLHLLADKMNGIIVNGSYSDAEEWSMYG